MTTLRIVRFIAWLLMTTALISGVAALFAGQWSIVALSVVAFFGIGLVFANAQGGVEQIARSRVAEDHGDVADMVSAGYWDGALRASNRAVNELSKTVRAVGASSENRGPLAATLVLQSALLGLNGDPTGSRFASQRAVSLLESLERPSPFAVALLQQARELQFHAHDHVYCARTAVALAS